MKLYKQLGSPIAEAGFSLQTNRRTHTSFTHRT